MVQLLKMFDWNWVSVVGSDDEYGQMGQQQFSSMANDESICVAYEGLIPVYSDPEQAVKRFSIVLWTPKWEWWWSSLSPSRPETSSKR